MKAPPQWRDYFKYKCALTIVIAVCTVEFLRKGFTPTHALNLALKLTFE